MNLLGHMIRSDLRRLRWPLLGWLALLLLTPVLGGLLLWTEAGVSRSFGSILAVGRGLFVLEFVAGLALVPLVIHGDPVVGTTAFWMTRPVSGTRMLGAKLLGSLIFLVALPLACELPWSWAGANGISLLRTFEWQMGIVLIGVAVAALSTSVPRFVAWTVVLQLGSLGLAPVVFDKNSPTAKVIISAFGSAPGAMLGACAVIVVAVAMAVLARYQRRSLRVVFGALGVGAAAAAAIGLTVLG